MRRDLIERRAPFPGRWPLAPAQAMAIVCIWGAAMAADPPRPVDELLRLVPADTSLVVTLEGLRDQLRSPDTSRLLADLRRLPAVKSWLESEKHRHLQRSCAEIESTLGVRLAEIRDQLLGDAVVLALRLPPGDRPNPSQARGLLLLRARDPLLPGRLIAAINAAQRDSGELKRVDIRRRGGTTYHVREFPEGSGRPPEWYVEDPDGTVAFSNSEEMIQAVVDRKAGGHSLGDSPRLLAVRRRLPERPLARLYVDPRAVEHLLGLATSRSEPADARLQALLRRHLAAVDYAGAALVWRPDAIVVHAVETLDPSRVDGWLRRWAADPRTCRAALRRVPPTALALASAHVDLAALRQAAYDVVPSPDHPRLRNLEMLLTGLLLGRDVVQMLPAIGPGVMAYLDGPAGKSGPADDPPARGTLFPLVVVVDLAAEGAGTNPDRGAAAPPSAVADALDNALRTLLVVAAMDEKHGRGRASLVTVEAAGTSVRTLSLPIPFAYAIDRAGGRLVLGTSAPSVARYLEQASDPESGARFRDFQAAGFPAYETFLCIDLDALTRLAGRYRTRLARNLAARQKRPAVQVEDDLENVLSLAGLFRAAFVASRIEPDASAIHRCFGVIMKVPNGQPGVQ